MELKQLLKGLPVLSVEGGLDCEVTGIAYDSRRVTPGMVFVAIPGQKTDGHEFIETAIERGATAIVCERDSVLAQRAAKIKVADVRRL